MLDGDLEVEHHIFEEQLWEILATRVPVFEKVKVREWLRIVGEQVRIGGQFVGWIL